MSGSVQAGRTRVELYVRSLSPNGGRRRLENVLERLSDLVDDESLSDYEVLVWGKRVPAAPADTQTEIGSFALNRVSVFREWAERNDRSLGPAFEERDVDSSLAGERRRAVVFPVAVLAEYHDDALTCVTPHARGDEIVHVEDHLARLASGVDADHQPLERAAPEKRPGLEPAATSR